MGKKILTEEEIERRKCAGHHVKAYRTEMGWTQEKCAEEWDINLMKLRRLEMNIEEKYRNDMQPVTEKTAKQIAQKTGICWEYWYGLSGFRDKKRYERAIREEAEHDAAESAALEEMHRDFIRQIEAYRGLFSMLGYEYENIGRTAAYDFCDIAPEQFGGKRLEKHNLTPADGTGKTLNLSDAQMEALIAYLKKQLDFAVFDLSHVAPDLGCHLPSDILTRT